MTSAAKADGRFNDDAFIYDRQKNKYTCPAGEALIWRFSAVSMNGKQGDTDHYWPDDPLITDPLLGPSRANSSVGFGCNVC